MGNISSSYEDAKILIGKTLPEAEDYIKTNNVFYHGYKVSMLRVVERDQFNSYIMNHFIPSCLDVYLEDDLIIDMY